jgi:hypothetical protein
MNIYIYLTFLLDTDIFPLLIKLGARKFICVLINCVSLYQPTVNSARILGTRGHLHTAAWLPHRVKVSSPNIGSIANSTVIGMQNFVQTIIRIKNLTDWSHQSIPY